MLLKGLNGIFVERRQKHDVGTMVRVKHADHLQPADAGHLNIKEQHVRAQLVHRADSLNGVGALPHNLNIRLLLQQNAQVFPCQRLVIHNQHS